MKDWKTVPIPQLMQDNCETDPRGMPIPFIVLKDNEGKHHFKINDHLKTIKCMQEGLCTICGTKLSYTNRWMVGGIASAFDRAGYYFDHPVHKECGVYALKVCPYLCYGKYVSKTDIEKLQEQVLGANLVDTTIDPDRLPLFVFLRPLQIAYYASKDLSEIKLKALGPYHEIEFWDEGEQITDFHIVELKLQGTKWEKYLKDMKYEAKIS